MAGRKRRQWASASVGPGQFDPSVTEAEAIELEANSSGITRLVQIRCTCSEVIGRVFLMSQGIYLLQAQIVGQAHPPVVSIASNRVLAGRDLVADCVWLSHGRFMLRSEALIKKANSALAGIDRGRTKMTRYTVSQHDRP